MRQTIMTDTSSAPICGDCGVTGPALFSDRYYCKRCKCVRAAVWRSRNPDRPRPSRAYPGNTPARQAAARRWHERNYLRKTYGITQDDWDAMFANQEGVCAICTSAFDTDDPNGIHVDHDHASGEVRGLLCRKCNLMLGNAQDSPANLRRAAAYLDRAAKPRDRREHE